ncbi:MAG: bifunctional 5,10-methylenetetrahydrofolate dehydrogenase/5,10-methenyltetrahydrofolate cyclohydrolase [Thermoanaerobaculia bacterium]
MERKTGARTLDGASLARRFRQKTRADAAATPGSPPHLRVILVGQDPASEVYVSSKTKAALEAGIRAETVRLQVDAPPERLLREVAQASGDRDVDGILVQLPLPPGHDARRVLDSVHPLKDVDGFHPENVGLLYQGRPRYIPCTPAGIIELLAAYDIPLKGQRAVVLGRSEIVGKPIAALLMARDATVTICHSKTRGLPAVCREADILVAAIGRPGFVTREFVREGAAVIDVGINRVTSLDGAPENLRRSSRVRTALEEKGRAIVGDVDFDDVARVASWITPVPGGVGPLTVAMLLRNTIKAASLRSSTK